jgi:hypothetical protein
VREQKKNSRYDDWDKLITHNQEFISERETKMEHFEDKKQMVDHMAYMSRESRPSIEEAATPTFFIT